MSDEDLSLPEKRIYADKTDVTTAFVGTVNGVVRVSVSDDIVGEFSLEWSGPVTDIAATAGRLAIGTPEDVFVSSGDDFRETGFGPVSAVGYGDNGGLFAAGEGRLARYDSGWTELGLLEKVRAIDGGMVAAESGIHRLDGSHVGLENARDVSTGGTPLAATEAGLYYLANGWMHAIDGDFFVAASDGTRSHAATTDTVYARNDTENEWTVVECPVDEKVEDIAYAENAYAVSEDGTFLANAGDGWRHQSLGLRGVTGMAVL